MERIEALAKLLGVEVEDLTTSKYNNRVFENEEAGEYIVLTEEEAYDAAKESIRNSIEDLGLESFSEGFQEWILDTCVDKEWFDGYLEEYYLDYINDIRDEEANYEGYESRLDEEMDDAGVDTEEEFLYCLIDDAGNSIDWYIDCFGYKEFKEVCEECIGPSWPVWPLWLVIIRRSSRPPRKNRPRCRRTLLSSWEKPWN